MLQKEKTKYRIEMIQDDIDEAETQDTQNGPMNLAIERCIDDAHDSIIKEDFLVFYVKDRVYQIEMSKQLKEYAENSYSMDELIEPITFIIEIEEVFDYLAVGFAHLEQKSSP